MPPLELLKALRKKTASQGSTTTGPLVEPDHIPEKSRWQVISRLMRRFAKSSKTESEFREHFERLWGKAERSGDWADKDKDRRWRMFQKYYEDAHNQGL